jgi:peptide/nickel transport system substrate-binding protein/oligopeptide transport system substrate-binding protein
MLSVPLRRIADLPPITRRVSLYLALCAVALSVAVLALLLIGLSAGQGAAQGVGLGQLGGPLALPDTRQVLRYGLPGSSSLGTLDPALATDPSTLQALQLVFPGLVTLDGDLRPQAWAASRIEVSPDGRVYTFHLRPNLRWSDGTPIDAVTFAYSINRALSPCLHSLVAYYLFPLKDAVRFNRQDCAAGGSLRAAPGRDAAVLASLVGDSVDIIDARTLALTLSQPVAYFLAALAYPNAAAVPRHLIDREGADWTNHLTDGGGLGGNFYVVRAWQPGAQLMLARDDGFWAQKPRLRQVEFDAYPDAGAQYRDYLAGHTQIGFAPADRYASARGRPGFAETGLLQIDYYAMNWFWPPFDDVRMRQALALALDKTALAQGPLRGAAYPTSHLVPQGMPGYDSGLSGPASASALGGDLARARALAQSYAKEKCNGSLAKCPGVTLTIPADDPSVAAQARAALGMWQAALPGYPITIATLDPGDLLDGLTTRTLQFWYVTWIADYPDAQDWLTNQFLPSSHYNSGGVNLPAATTLMLEGDIMSDPARRTQLYNAAEQLLVTNVAWLALDQPKLWWETAPSLTGFRLDGRGMSALGVWQQAYLAQH